ncbi:chromosome partitioning protein ParB [Paenibacillus sp. MY03]|jgi:ParB family chromosome partitioning protein|uniref:ParB/RepB/Spo0J family partition protein n=1 Tax=Paenibacillus sp. MY03 TaxID=302980 RepID=UPI000B3C0117|nr:ParB/RepB/Spo0J family partition protein [Paenibacillus sp. MY03]OUS74971.1 chromosome partitioning protein ParB [Paenibacillus sp. MY03]
MDIIEIPLSLIEEDKDQPRYQFDEEALGELMQSIEELGLLSPIKVRTMEGGRYRIIYGNRRYKATEMLGRKTIPCIVSTTSDEMEIYLEQIAENLTREGFSPIEEAIAFDKLMNDGRFRSSLKFLSAKLGKPESYIKNKCELLKFSKAVQKLIVSGTEIRKDKLTEDQLMPLKDLSMEHRDPLALIAARDELPVSDVKKIAKLFKDKTISDNTKEKLLLKTGSGLIETWSVYEQNRKNKKAAEEAEADEPNRKGSATGNASNATSGASVSGAASNATTGATAAGAASTGYTTSQAASGAAGEPLSPSAYDGAGRAADGSSSQAVGAGAASKNVNVSDLLRKLQQELPRQTELSRSIAKLVVESDGEGQVLFTHEVDAVVEQLEEQLALWKSLREKSPL